MSVISFFLLLAISIAARYLIQKLVPLALPKGRLKVVAVGWLGGLAAHLLEGIFGPWEPRLGGIYPAAAVLGSVVSIMGWGLAPFFYIFLGLNRKQRNKARASMQSHK